ncbi:MAG TPA: NAD(P)H-hydrate dehydratase [Marmoricola sp.]|nr:NAD(P)H-hydrate dehydratase [Marmoricola sp.]
MPHPDTVEVTEGTLRQWRLPEPASDKDTRGEVLVVGGGARTPGGVLLAGEASLRVGGGKLRIATAGTVAPVLAVSVPEALVAPLPEDGGGAVGPTAADEVRAIIGSADVVLLGPGMGDPGASVGLLRQVVPGLDAQVVVDALASAFVTEHPHGLRHLSGRCVLTVNPNELARVLDRDEAHVTGDPVRAALDGARLTGAVVLCGGTVKAVGAPDGASWVVRPGGPGLGVSGSGDVQAGLVAGLLARGATPPQAAVWGAYLHGSAGDRLARSVGEVGFLARELLPVVPRLLAELTAR